MADTNVAMEEFGGMSQEESSAYDDLRMRVAELVESMERPPVVGISGHGGSGKTTLATRLLIDVGGSPEQVVSTDYFYAEDAGPHSGMFDLHDWAGLVDLLRRLQTGPAPQRLSYPVRMYDGAERCCDVPMPPVVLVEGIRLIRPETMPLLDLAVWIDLDPDAAGRRAIRRNRDQGDAGDELDLWSAKWIPEGHAYARALRPDRLAHVVISAAGPVE